jgi:hypothetical protein
MITKYYKWFKEKVRLRVYNESGSRHPIHYRAYLYFGEGRETLDLEFTFPSDFLHVGFSVGDEPNIGLFFANYLFGAWIGIHGKTSSKIKQILCKGHDKKELSIGRNEEFIHWKIWMDPHSWSSKNPRWRDGSFDLAKFFFGKLEYSTKDISEHDLTAPMPEGNYPVHVKMFESFWRRSRWFGKSLMRAEITVKSKGGIPMPGKGENSWDCGMDGTYAMTLTANNPAEAVGKLITDVLQDRYKRGGPWVELTPKEREIKDFLE